MTAPVLVTEPRAGILSCRICRHPATRHNTAGCRDCRCQHAAQPHRVDRAALAEDICWLRDTGEHPERAAQRLGLTPDALAKNIQRLGIAWPAALTAQRRLHA